MFTIGDKLYYRNIKGTDNKAFLIDSVNGGLFNLVGDGLGYDDNSFLYTRHVHS